MKQLLSTSILLAINLSAQAQTPLNDPWPAPPKFDLSDNYTKEEREVVERIKPYYDMTEKGFSHLPLDKLWQVPGLRDKALEQFDVPPSIKGRIALIPRVSNPAGVGYATLNLVRIGGPKNEQPQVFYRREGGSAYFGFLILAPNGKTAAIKQCDSYEPEYSVMFWDIEAARFRYRGRNSEPLNQKYGLMCGADPVWSPGSRYLIVSRAQMIGQYEYSDPQFCVLDTHSRRERAVATQVNEWSWTYHGEILFSSTEGEGGKTLPNPAVFAIKAESGTPRKLFDNGSIPHESPKGRWIAFYDWSNELTPKSKTSMKRTKRGLYLWDKVNKKRQFIGAMNSKYERPFRWSPDRLFQWSPDGQALYIAEPLDLPLTVPEMAYTIYKMKMTDKKLVKLAEIHEPRNNVIPQFKSHGISPDGKRLYFDWCSSLGQIDNYPTSRYTLFAIDTTTGQQTNIARLTSEKYEYLGWDWHDDSGVNPAFAVAEKFENALLPIR